MNKNITAKIKLAIVLTCAITTLCFALTGCSSISRLTTNTNEQTPAEQNRAYMSKVNQAMTTLDTNLTSFTDAVSRGDTISMKTQSDKAMTALDDVKSIEAPDALKDVKTKYDAGCESLKQALTQYVNLYTSGAEVTQDSLTPIQELYNSGVNSLKEADSDVASKS